MCIYSSKDIFLLISIKFPSISAEKYALEADWSIQVSMVTQNFWASKNLKSKGIFLLSSIKFPSILAKKNVLKADWSIHVSMVTQFFF